MKHGWCGLRAQKVWASWVVALSFIDWEPKGSQGLTVSIIFLSVRGRYWMFYDDGE